MSNTSRPDKRANRPPRLRPDRAGAWLSLAANLLWLGQAAVIAWGIAALIDGTPGPSPLLLALAYFATTALRGGFEAAAQRHLSDHADDEIARLRQEIIATEARMSTPSVLGHAGALAAMAGEKLEALRPYLLRYQPAMLRTRVVPLIILAIALWHSWAVAVVLAVAGPLIPVFMALVGWAAKEASERQMAEIGDLSDLLVDRLAALSDLRLIGAGPALVAGFHDSAERLRRRTMAVLRVAFLSSTVLELFAALGVAMVAVWVGFALLGSITWGSWGTPITPFAGIFLLLLTPEFFQPLRDLAASWHDKQAAAAVEDELETWRKQVREPMLGATDGASPTTPALPAAGPIRLSGVMVSRGTRRLIFPDLEISPGTSLAITGPSGVGKTTLLRTLAGLERPEAGTILIGAVPLGEDTASAWRRRLGWMPQQPHFLSRSLRHNLAFGAPLRPEVLAQARFGRVIDTLPHGLDTRLGERGAGLSGGEARRAMLVRALNGTPDVVLADEPTADLDRETAMAIADGLTAFARQGGTLIVATHDPALMARMDKVIALGTEAGT